MIKRLGNLTIDELVSMSKKCFDCELEFRDFDTCPYEIFRFDRDECILRNFCELARSLDKLIEVPDYEQE